ncbi:MAG TPA: hypothetical protein VFJ79_03680 [Acidimicrobiales bacterium]|nr:hypothetical protein [Acidimicrobiales bacterium]
MRQNRGQRMDTPVQWMTLEGLRVELRRTRPAWEAVVVEGGEFLDSRDFEDLVPDAVRHQRVTEELARRQGDSG